MGYKIILGTTIFFVIIGAIIIIVGTKGGGLKDIDNAYKESRRVRIWLLSSLFWTAVDYYLVALSFICSISTVFVSASNGHDRVSSIILPVFAATAVVLSFIINPKRHVRGYRAAYALGDYSLSLFKNDLISKQELIASIHEGELLINQAYDAETVDRYSNSSKTGINTHDKDKIE